MAKVIEIQDLNQPELDVFARLTEAQLRSRRRPEEGMFIAESPKVIACALRSGCVPVSFLMERRHVEGDAAELLAQCPDVPVYTGEREVLSSLTGYALTRGVLCAMRRPELPTVEQVCENAKRIAVIEGVVDLTNVGAIFRSAAALNMDAVLIDPTCCDPLHRRAARVSMGTVFQVPWTRLAQIGAEGMETLRGLGFRTAAMALDERAVSVADPILQQEDKLAVVLGTEGDGLPKEIIAACDYTVMIPMSHGVDSLNVAAASAVAFWQLGRR
jgi:tRNA G18 (ribose-2'-O)-methylase SpoU